jgi:hypothetical protein
MGAHFALFVTAVRQMADSSTISTSAEASLTRYFLLSDNLVLFSLSRGRSTFDLVAALPRFVGSLRPPAM